MSGLLSYSGLTTKIRAMQSHLLNDQNFREIVELESVPQAVSYLTDEKEIAGDHPDADGLGSGVCLFLSGIH